MSNWLLADSRARQARKGKFAEPRCHPELPSSRPLRTADGARRLSGFSSCGTRSVALSLCQWNGGAVARSPPDRTMRCPCLSLIRPDSSLQGQIVASPVLRMASTVRSWGGIRHVRIFVLKCAISLYRFATDRRERSRSSGRAFDRVCQVRYCTEPNNGLPSIERDRDVARMKSKGVSPKTV